MLVVPRLVWPILFGQNHLDMVGAKTDHTKRIVTFTDPDLNFSVSCPNENQLDLYPRLGNPYSNSPRSGTSSANVITPVRMLTCTSTPTPSQPSEPIKLHLGFNLVTLCLVMTASLVGSSMFSNSLWLEGNEVCPGVHVVSGPISFLRLAFPPNLLFQTHHRPSIDIILNVDQVVCYQNQKNPQARWSVGFSKFISPV